MSRCRRRLARSGGLSPGLRGQERRIMRRWCRANWSSHCMASRERKRSEVCESLVAYAPGSPNLARRTAPQQRREHGKSAKQQEQHEINSIVYFWDYQPVPRDVCLELLAQFLSLLVDNDAHLLAFLVHHIQVDSAHRAVISLV